MTFCLHPYSYRRTARRHIDGNQHTLGVNSRDVDEACVLSAFVPGLKTEQETRDQVRFEGHMPDVGLTGVVTM